MADISHKDLLESLGNSAAGFTKTLANQAASFACGLYKDYPWALTIGDLGNYSKGFWDELCASRPEGVPPPPTSPYSGGQCDMVMYKVDLTWNTFDGTIGSHSPGDYYGPITAVEFVVSPLNRQDSRGYLQELWITCKGNYSTPRPLGRYQMSTQYAYATSLRSVTLTRVDGYPDNCGNVSAEYPQTPVPSSQLTKTITINNSDNTVYNVPITITYPPVNTYNLEFSAGDLRFTFDLGGVSFSTNPVYNQLNQTYNNIENVTGAVTNLAQNFNSFSNNATNTSLSWNLGNFTATSISGSSAKDDEDKQSNLAYVTVDLTQVPVNANTQEGAKAQDVLYAGWFQFVAEGYYYPREPIHFRKAVFRAPSGATSYAYTLYKGFIANVTEYRV